MDGPQQLLPAGIKNRSRNYTNNTADGRAL
jgi:hypothetical protein